VALLEYSFEPLTQSLEPEMQEESVAEEPEIPMAAPKKERQNRKLLEGLPVVEVIIEPQDVDLTKYKQIGEERTRTLEFEPGKLYVKEIVRPKYYAYTLWPGMKNYLKDGRLKIDNNPAENAIRPIALSRKNFLFCGNHEAAENMAVIRSLLASCKASRVNPREWLTDVIVRLPYYTNNKVKDLKELLPNCWKQRNSKEL